MRNYAYNNDIQRTNYERTTKYQQTCGLTMRQNSASWRPFSSDCATPPCFRLSFCLFFPCPMAALQYTGKQKNSSSTNFKLLCKKISLYSYSSFCRAGYGTYCRFFAGFMAIFHIRFHCRLSSSGTRNPFTTLSAVPDHQHSHYPP